MYYVSLVNIYTYFKMFGLYLIGHHNQNSLTIVNMRPLARRNLNVNSLNM
jgi:hypothetical protein